MTAPVTVVPEATSQRIAMTVPVTIGRARHPAGQSDGR